LHGKPAESVRQGGSTRAVVGGEGAESCATYFIRNNGDVLNSNLSHPGKKVEKFPEAIKIGFELNQGRF